MSIDHNVGIRRVLRPFSLLFLPLLKLYRHSRCAGPDRGVVLKGPSLCHLLDKTLWHRARRPAVWGLEDLDGGISLLY